MLVEHFKNFLEGENLDFQQIGEGFDSEIYVHADSKDLLIKHYYPQLPKRAIQKYHFIQTEFSKKGKFSQEVFIRDRITKISVSILELPQSIIYPNGDRVITTPPLIKGRTLDSIEDGTSKEVGDMVTEILKYQFGESSTISLDYINAKVKRVIDELDITITDLGGNIRSFLGRFREIRNF